MNYQNLIIDPTINSILGDIGYIDKDGKWRKIVNIFNKKDCNFLSIKSLKITDFIKNSELLCENPYIWREDKGTSNIKINESKNMEIILSPPEITNETTQNKIIMIIGPYIYIDKIEISQTIVDKWINEFHKQIKKSLKNMKRNYKPQNRYIYFIDKEYKTRNFKTVTVKWEEPNKNIVFHYRINDLSYGVWMEIYPYEYSKNMTTSGIGSYPNGTEWIVSFEKILINKNNDNCRII